MPAFLGVKYYELTVAVKIEIKTTSGWKPYLNVNFGKPIFGIQHSIDQTERLMLTCIVDTIKLYTVAHGHKVGFGQGWGYEISGLNT